MQPHIKYQVPRTYEYSYTDFEQKTAILNLEGCSSYRGQTMFKLEQRDNKKGSRFIWRSSYQAIEVQLYIENQLAF